MKKNPLCISVGSVHTAMILTAYWSALVRCKKLAGREAQGVYLKKKLTGGLGLFFWSEIFNILIFFGFRKISIILLGLKIFHLFFWGNNFDTIYFFECPIKRS